MEDIYQIQAPYFTAGLVVKNNLCTTAAPIIKYMKGWTLARIQIYCNQKKWKLEWVNPQEAVK